MHWSECVGRKCGFWFTLKIDIKCWSNSALLRLSSMHWTDTVTPIYWDGLNTCDSIDNKKH